MIVATPVHPEGARYEASIAYLPGLWTSPDAFRPVATYLGHRGWAGTLLDFQGVTGGLDARGAAVAGWLAGLPAAPILIGHDAGALVALATASRIRVAAVVLLAPLVPGAAGTHAFAWSRGLVWSLLTRGRVRRPEEPMRSLAFGTRPLSPRGMREDEDPRLLAELARRVPVPRPTSAPPTLVLRGATDALVSAADAVGLARDVAGEVGEVPEGGHALLAEPAWQPCVHRVHRWLVQRLGAANLELYEEAMAERGDDPDEP